MYVYLVCIGEDIYLADTVAGVHETLAGAEASKLQLEKYFKEQHKDHVVWIDKRKVLG